MSDLPVFPDVELVLMDLFADIAATAAATIVTNLPAALQEVLPIIRVRRLGGTDDRWTDKPRVDVQVYSAVTPAPGGRTAAVQLAATLQARLLSWPRTTPHGVIDYASTEVGPQEIPYEDQDIRLITATYRLSLRRP